MPETTVTDPPTLPPASQRALALAEDVADLIKDLCDRLSEMNIELGLPAPEIRQLVMAQIPEEQHEHRMLFWHAWEQLWPIEAMKIGDDPLRRVIGRLFEQAPKLTDGKGHLVPDQAPAIEQCAIMFKNGGTIQGVLSITPEGTFRMMTPSVRPGTRPGLEVPVLVEQFFEYEHIAMVAVPREVEQKPKIVGA